MVVPSQPSAPYFQQKKKNIMEGQVVPQKEKKTDLTDFCIFDQLLYSESIIAV